LQNAESVISEICMGGTRCIGRLIKVCAQGIELRAVGIRDGGMGNTLSSPSSVVPSA
jgi:hypothetical protein